MNAQDLKNSILQLAVQGKLVEQRAEEGTARELLEQIKLEKDQLILDTLGEHVATNFIEGKMKEWDDYRTQVTDWELARYMIQY